MKKILTSLLALFASCTLLSACSIVDDVKGWFDKNSASESTDTTSEDTTSEDSTSEELPPVDPHVEALELAKEFVYGDLVEKDLEVTKDYTLLGSTYSFVLDEALTVSWTVDVTEGVVLTYDEAKGEWKVDVDEFAEEDIFYTLTATIADSDGHSVSFTLDRKVLKAADVVPEKITEAPVEGEAYKLYMYQEQKKNDLYFTGAMKGFYLNTNNASNGEGHEVSVDVFVEKVEGKDAYYLTFTNKEGQKQYIGVTNPFNNGSFHVNAILRDTVDTTLDAGEVCKTFEFTWDNELKTLVATLEGVKSGKDESTTETKTDSYFLGTSGSYYTFGAMSVSEAEGAYVGYLVKMVNKAEVSAEDKVASEKETLNVTTAFSGAVEYTLPTQGTTYGDVAISWAVKSGDATLTDNVLNVANPTADTTIVLTATFTCGEATTTKDVEITVYPKSPVTQVTELKEGEAYTVYMYHTTNAKNYYFTGAMSGKYLATTDDVTKAAKVYIENVDGGFKVYVMDANGAKSYIALEAYQAEGKSYISASVSLNTVGSVFTYNSQFLTLCCKAALADNSKSDVFFLGTYGTFTTMSASGSYYMTADKLGTEQFYATFGIIDESALPPEGGDPVVPEVTTSSIASILAAENGEYMAQGTVMAVTAKSFVLKDSTGMMLVYLNAAPSVKAGDVVTVKGTTSVYGMGKQFGAGSEVTFVSEGSVGLRLATSLTASDVDAYAAVTNVTIKYVEVTGTLGIDGNYYNLVVDGATAVASISYPNDELKAELADLNGKEISVEGYFIGVTGKTTKYVQIMATSVRATDEGIGDDKPGVDEECKHEYDKEGICVNCGEKDPDFKPEVEEPEVPENAQTATLSIADYAAANSWANSTLYSQITMENGIVITANGTPVGDYGLNTGKYYTNGNNWRIYQNENPSVVITAADGMTIFSVKVSYAVKNTGTLTFNGANVESDEIVYVNAASATFSVANTGTATNGQAQITAIEVVYVAGEEGGEIIPPAHEHNFVEGKCECGEVDPDYKPEAPADDLLIVGKPYLFGMTQANVNNNVYYLAGGMDGYYMATTTDEKAAISTYIEETTGGYYFYTLNADGSKLYINMVVSGTHVNGAYQATASTVYTIDETNVTLIAVVNNTEYWFGTRNDKTYTTMGPCAVSYAGFFGEFYPVDSEGGEIDPPAHEHNFVEGKCECGETDPNYVPPHEHNFVEGKCECGEVDPDYKPEAPADDLLIVGKPYLFGMTQANVNNNVYYLAGGMDGYYMATTTDEKAAISTYIEETTGGYYFYTLNADGSKLYINMVVSGTHVNGAYQATASTVYTIDEKNVTLIAIVNNTEYWFGTRNDKTYTTMGPCAVSYAGFFGEFYPVDSEGGEVTPPAHEHNFVEGKCECGEVDPNYTPDAPHVHSYTPVVTAPKCSVAGYTTYTCECGDSYVGDETPALPHVDANLDIYCDNGCSNRIFPEAGSKISLFTATAMIKFSITNDYYVEGVITDMGDAKNGIFTITDEAGDILCIRLPKNADGISYSAWTTLKVVVGDTVRVTGKPKTSTATTTSKAKAMIDGGLLEVLKHDHNFSEATCTEASVCACLAINTPALGHINENGDNLCDRCQWNLNLRISNIVVATDTTLANGVQTMGDDGKAVAWTWEDDNFSVVIAKGASTFTLYTTAKAYMQLKKQNTLTVTNKTGATIQSITISTTNATQLTNLVNALANNNLTFTQDAEALTVTIAWNSTEDLLISHNGSTTAYVSGVEVVYEPKSEGGEIDPPAHEHNFVEGKCECGETDPNYVPPHEHNFVEGKCECGEVDPDYVAPHEHNYTPVVTAPTCTAAGYTTYTCGCGDSYTADEVVATGHKDEGEDYKCDACSAVMAPEADSFLTIPQAIALGKALGPKVYTTNKYYMTVIIESVYNTQYGNANVKDADGNKYVIYGIYNYDGKVRYDALEYKPVAGDELTIYGVIGSHSYDGTAFDSMQMKNGWIDEVVAHEHAYSSQVTAPTCTAEGYTTHTCTICQASYVDGETPALGHTTENGVCDNCGQTIGGDAPAEPSVVATFDFGANGTGTTHVDGNALGASKSYTSGSYTLSLTGMSKVFGPAYDLKQNSCLKLGTSKVVGKFSFTVPANVSKVIIHVAGYKSAATTNIKVNGTQSTVKTLSDKGEYTAIEIDTSSNKTVTFETVTYRCMINAIDFVGLPA